MEVTDYLETFRLQLLKQLENNEITEDEFWEYYRQELATTMNVKPALGTTEVGKTMLTEKQLQQMRDTIMLLNAEEKASTQEFIETLNLPSWFDPKTCVIVMNRMHEKTFKEYALDWIAFSDYIYFDQMIVMDKTQPFTPITTYSQGDKKYGNTN